MHDEAPLDPWKAPDAQPTHAVDPAAIWYKPDEQTEHVVDEADPIEVDTVPAAQPTQLAEPP